MAHYFTEKQTSDMKLKKFSVILRNRELEFFTGSGMFSPSKIDLGSKLLINDSVIKENSDILDLGCGYGPVGITLANVFPTCNITLVDVNERALYLAKQNAKLNKVSNVNIKKSNAYAKLNGKTFDTILLNPPQSAGKRLCLDMIEGAKHFLKLGGTIQVVARHQKGGKSFEKFMNEIFGNVTTVSKKSGYRIYLSELK